MAIRSVADILEECNLRLRRAEQAYMTLTWPEFYELCGRERLKQPFLDKVQNVASGRFQLIVAYGQNAVMVCRDRNFASIDPDE